jgi:hypothetical protein
LPPSGLIAALIAKLGQLPIKRRQLLAKPSNPGELLAELLRLFTVTGSGTQPIGQAVEPARNRLTFATGGRLLSVLSLPSLSLGSGGGAHPFGQPLCVDILHRLAERISLSFVGSRATRQLFHTFFDSSSAIGQPLLFGGSLSRAVRTITRPPGPVRVVPETPLCIRKLPRFELELAKRATTVVGLRSAHLLLDVAQPLRRAVTACTRLPRVVATKLACGVLHVLRRLLQLAACLLTVATLSALPSLSALSALSVLRRLPSLTLPALPLLVLCALSLLARTLLQLARKFLRASP